MRPHRGFVWGCALAVLSVASGSAQAAWNNVFQVCCHNCRSGYSANASPIVAYAAPAADPCPQPQPCQQCTTRYVQRCYYQQVTSYKQVTYMEPVTTYRTSYYYEPVCSYRYSCYYDPCTCTTQSVATPVTSYRLRSQCCPVTSYLQRCALQPVTSYQQMTYYEPQTTCCTTTIGAPVAAPPAGGAVAAPPPGAVAVPPPGAAAAVQPNVIEPRSPAVQPNVTETQPPPAYPGGTGYKRLPQDSIMPRANDSSFRQAPQTPAPSTPIRARYDRIASRTGPNTEGSLRSGNRPLAGEKILFVSTVPGGERRAVTTDQDGRFQATLASGSWIVYLQGADGRPVYNQSIEVQPSRPVQLALFARR